MQRKKIPTLHLPTFYLIPLLLTTLYLTPYSSFAQFNAKQIDIIRDTYGVPHIFGKTDPEVAYGLAWAHAEDDFETIQQSLMAGKAMLAQYQGKKGASIDYIIHLLRIPELVAAKYDSDLSPDFKKIIRGLLCRTECICPSTS